MIILLAATILITSALSFLAQFIYGAPRANFSSQAENTFEKSCNIEFRRATRQTKSLLAY